MVVPDKIYMFPPEIKQTVRMLANQFHPLLIISDPDGKHQDVLYLTDILTGSSIKGGQLYPLFASSDTNRMP